MSVPVFEVKYSKIEHTRCSFLNIFVQDCRNESFYLSSNVKKRTVFGVFQLFS